MKMRKGIGELIERDDEKALLGPHSFILQLEKAASIGVNISFGAIGSLEEGQGLLKIYAKELL